MGSSETDWLTTGSTVEVTVKRFTEQGVTELEDELAVEEPLEIQLDYTDNGKRIRKSLSVTMRTPGNDRELATGFLFTEGIITDREQVQEAAPSPVDPNRIRVQLTADAIPLLPATDRNFYTTSSCGVCGKTGIDAIKSVSMYADTADTMALAPGVLMGLAAVLQQEQALFRTTGGLHASALFDQEGRFRYLREDVGRHNALDKVIGAAFMEGKLPLTDSLLLLSGRASFELVQKAHMAGIKIVVAIGAPSSLAVSLAAETDMTLAGFLREGRFVCYTGARRIVLPESGGTFELNKLQSH